ncbi:type II toxin-antitoxin system PemK/MazF family toxin [Flavobacterium sp.]|uniref:type II toxin-antitoxin system PemK/MazF family toxin n=1 Tax=Flavobacterium sp. TaxID=239 RepID=UPI002611A801|nr:type II toxin-antitoxin system PemK/MazF family toxin [Flavobacterium sp.]MDD3003299.1 type II toxin-antitoxin system PemK/MazF family toxin [Flavobacterium sp.]
MSFQKGDIIDVFFDLPYSKETKTHPAIIISNEDVYDKDDLYVCVMMTSSTETDLFTFEVTQDMLVQKNNKDFSQARCHLISYVMEKHIVGTTAKNTLKENALKRLLIKINDTVF